MSQTQSVVEAHDTRSRREALRVRLSSLYREELKDLGSSDYLVAHASPNSIARQIDVFERYLPYLPYVSPAPGSTILDWGCHHAPDSCMLRAVLGEAVTLHGCDFNPPGRFAHFHGFAGLAYRQLQDPISLPYASHSFDVVISSGVLEHTMMDYESLKELHRVLKDQGLLIITFLPNRLSLSEFVSRRLKMNAHLRLYGMAEALRMLRHFGFNPLHHGYHQFLPAHNWQRLMAPLWPLNGVLDRAWPLNRLCANLMIVSQARAIM
jgi:SAM-dependent methyltransferase